MMFAFKKHKQDKTPQDLLSIVIPLYNHDQFIGEAIESVLHQTYHNWELIIIDDGSVDNSVQVARSYHDPRISLFVQENAGAHNAINRGLSMARGDYLAILNSDDVFEKDRFKIMIQEMKKNPEIDFLCSYLYVIDDNGKQLGIKKGWKNMEPWILPNPEKTFKATDDFKLNLLMANFISTTSNFLFSRRLYEKIGGMRNLRFAHDWDFTLRASETAECRIIEKPLMKYRIHSSNTISSNRKWMLFEIAWIWAANLERFYGTLLFKDDNSFNDIFSLAESINLQGNDRIFWIIKAFIDAQKKRGVKHPEEILLNNDELRNKLLAYIEE